MKIDLELQWIKAVVTYEKYQLKYGINPSTEDMSMDERIEYVCNQQMRYKLFEILNKYINPFLTEDERKHCSDFIRREYNY